MAPSERSIVLAGEDGEVERYTVLEERGVKGRPKDAKGYSEPYVTVFQAALARLVADRDLTRTDLRVWGAVLSRATIEEPEFDAAPAEIGELLQMDTKTVIRTVTRLASAGFLLRPRRGKLALPPDVAWRGTVLARESALKSARES